MIVKKIIGVNTMTIREIADELGVEKYPSEFDKLAGEISLSSTEFLNTERLVALSREYAVLGEYEDEFIKYAELMKEDMAIVAWGNIATAYLESVCENAIATMEFPLPKKAQRETSVDIFPMVILMGRMDYARREYIRLGADEETVKGNLASYGKSLRNNTEHYGRLCLRLGHYAWLALYACGLIFNLEGYNFELRKYIFNGVYIKNKLSGEHRVIMRNEMLHKSGFVLGSAGCEGDGWLADYEETDGSFSGYVAEDGCVVGEKQTFSKNEWEKVLDHGDYVYAMHIPSKADLTSANLDKVFEKALPKMQKFYGDKNVRYVICDSWLLSPQLKKILKPTSNITAFGDRFLRIPVKSSGMAPFSTVFKSRPESYAELPETNSLERGLKNMYMNGEYLYNYMGAFEI